MNDGAARLEPIDFEDRFAAVAWRPREDGVGRGADHHAHDLVVRRVPRGSAACVPPVAQDDEAIGDAQHLFDEVRDVDNGVPLRLEPLEHREQMVHVGGPEAARRLVQHEHGAADGKRARDLDDLLRRGREAPGRRVKRKVVVAQLRERRAGDLPHASPVEHAKTRGLDAQGDVFDDGEVGRE